MLVCRLLLALTMVFTYPMECFVARHSIISLMLTHEQDVIKSKQNSMRYSSCASHSGAFSHGVPGETTTNDHTANTTTITTTTNTITNTITNTNSVISEQHERGARMQDALVDSYRSYDMDSVSDSHAGYTPHTHPANISPQKESAIDQYYSQSGLSSGLSMLSGISMLEEEVFVEVSSSMHVIVTVVLFISSLVLAVIFNNLGIVLALTGGYSMLCVIGSIYSIV